jgi:hypothetical protein
VATGVTTGGTYAPGDSLAHTYTIHAVNSYGNTASNAIVATDFAAGGCSNPAAITISGISDVSACAQSGIQVAFTGGSGATSFDLYKDGVSVVTGYVSGATYNPGDTASHTYKVRGIVSTCYTDSGNSTFADANGTPGAPVITVFNDVSACAQSGIQITYTPGSGASSHNLYKDGGLVVTGYVSAATYNPGDTASHTYKVRAINGACFTDSSTSAYADTNNTPGAPAITGFNDVAACAQSGIQITYTAGSGAISHNLYNEGGLVVTGYVSGATYNPGNTASHTYKVRAINGACFTDSSTSAFADANGTPGAPVITAVTDLNPAALTGITVTYTAGSGATSHNLYMDGGLVVTGYTSGATYAPGDSATHTYMVKAINAPCTNDSNNYTGIDANTPVTLPEVDPGTDPGTAQGNVDKDTPSWHAVTGATGYKLYRGILGDLPSLLNSSTDSCLIYTGAALFFNDTSDPSLVAGNLYWYLVTAYNGSGEGPAGDATAGPRTINGVTCP